MQLAGHIDGVIEGGIGIIHGRYYNPGGFACQTPGPADVRGMGLKWPGMALPRKNLNCGRIQHN